MNKMIFIAALLMLSACNDVKKPNHQPRFLTPIPQQCQGKMVFYGVVRQQAPKSAGLFLDRPANLTNVNLGTLRDKSLIGKIVMVTGKLKPPYPPGGKAKNGNHFHVVYGAKILKVVESDKDIQTVTRECR